MSKGFGCLCICLCDLCSFSFFFFFVVAAFDCLESKHNVVAPFVTANPHQTLIIQAEKCVHILQLKVCVINGEGIYKCPVVCVLLFLYFFIYLVG